MKIGLAQIEVVPKNIELNLKKIIHYIKEARKTGLDMVVFPEMVVGGYLIGDDWEREDYIDKLLNANEKIKSESAGIIVVWGNVDVDLNKKNEDGRWRKYNAAFVASEGKWMRGGVGSGRTYKSLMPKYREFDDERHFYSLQKYAIERKKGIEELLQPFETNIGKVGIMLCEDMWSDDYSLNPTEILTNNGADILVNISCSPWTIGKNDKRHRVVRSRLSRAKLPFFYCNNVGIQNNGKNIFVFDGGSTIYNNSGVIVSQLKSFEEGLLTFDSSDEKVTADTNIDLEDDVILKSLVYGVRKFFEKLLSKKAVIGISGGVDSALVSCILVKALGRENVIGVNMPSRFNSDLTKSAAEKLAKNLGFEYKVVPIQESVDLTVSQLEKSGFEVSDLAKENIQARDRGSRVLAAIASVVGGVFTNNGNKTETALGYCTLYGDVNGAIAPIADLYKGQVYSLAKYINKVMDNVIPREIMNVVPSAELSEKQDVTKGMGDPMIYPYHDKLIRAFVEWRWGTEKVVKLFDLGKLEESLQYEGNISELFESRNKFLEDLENKWKMFQNSFFKRVQAPPIIVVSRRAFGFDLRESL